MAEKPVETRPPARSRRRAALAAAALFPALVSAGIFAPGLVELALQSGGSTTGGGKPQGPRSAFDHRPLPAPRDPALGITPVALELDRLFFETEFRGAEPAPDFDGTLAGGAGAGPTPAEIAQLLSFPRHDTDPILLDQLAPPQEQVVFKDALIPDQIPQLQLPSQGDLFLPLCNTIPATDCLRFDDFTTVSEEVPIPEPGTGLLAALGLALLAWRGRAARGRRAGTPPRGDVP
jgi:hypothetical protein